MLKSHLCSPKSNHLEVGRVNSAHILFVLLLVTTWFHDYSYPSGDCVRMDLASTGRHFPQRKKMLSCLLTRTTGLFSSIHVHRNSYLLALRYGGFPKLPASRY